MDLNAKNRLARLDSAYTSNNRLVELGDDRSFQDQYGHNDIRTNQGFNPNHLCSRWSFRNLHCVIVAKNGKVIRMARGHSSVPLFYVK